MDEDGSERLMLKYYQYLLEAKNLVWHYFGIEVLHNLDKFPLRLDDTLQEYYKKISEKIERHPVIIHTNSKDKYYIQKIKPLFVNRRIYYEITFTPVDDRKNKSKSNRVIAFTKLPIKSNYASKFHLVHETIEILGKTMPIIIICLLYTSTLAITFQKVDLPLRPSPYAMISASTYTLPIAERPTIL